MKLSLFSALLLAPALHGLAATVEYDLVIAEQSLSPAGTPVRALTINGTMPGPTLRFTEGDTALIHVHNHLKYQETSTHWHGLLVPNEQDGVPYITTAPIFPGGAHTFEFKLKHSGTYWYHSHTHLQEQRGVLGAIVVLPRGGEPIKADRDEVLMLSDWTNEDPGEVLRTLIRGSDYYNLRRGSAQSIAGAIKRGALKDYFDREWTRMPPMDVSDIAYDAFLINGRRTQHLAGKPGERIRLRIINAGSSSYFYVRSSSGPLTVIAADGPAVEPAKIGLLLMSPAETYDVLFTIPKDGEWELRATPVDGSGHASVFFGQGTAHPASDPPRANVYTMDEVLDTSLAEKEDDPRASLNLARPGTPYRVLRATHDTTPPVSAPVRKLTMHLTGDMSRYVWSLNGKTINQESTVPLHRGEVLQIELINDTMMHHPMHLHGHFFRVLNGQGSRSPLKHTVDIAPMSSRTIEFEANEEKDWMFHCHILYHMMGGMARVFSYDKPMADAANAPAAHSMGEHSHNPWYFWGAATLESNMSEGALTARNGDNDFFAKWKVGWQGLDKTEYEVDALYQRYFSADFQAFAGARLTNDFDANDRAIIGFNYRLPLLVWSTVTMDSRGDARFTLAKHLQITNRLSAFAQIEYDTGTQWEWTTGAEYTLSKSWSLITQYHSRYGLGAGASVRF